MNPLKRWLLGLVSLFSVLAITGCQTYPVEGTVVEKEHEPASREYNHSTKKWKQVDECYELDLYDHEADQGVELCVSERVFNDAQLGKKITLTEDYH